MVQFISDIQEDIGKEKFTFESKELPGDFFYLVKDYAIDRVKEALDTDDKLVRDARLAPIVEDVTKLVEEKCPEYLPSCRRGDVQGSKICWCAIGYWMNTNG